MERPLTVCPYEYWREGNDYSHLSSVGSTSADCRSIPSTCEELIARLIGVLDTCFLCETKFGNHARLNDRLSSHDADWS